METKGLFASKTFLGIFGTILGNIDPVFDWLGSVLPPSVGPAIPILKQVLIWGGSALGIYGRATATTTIKGII